MSGSPTATINARQEVANMKENEIMTNAILNQFLEAIAQVIENKTGDKEAADIVRSFKTK